MTDTTLNSKEDTFRFAYFTEKYQETFNFYKQILAFPLEHSWDRSTHDKGALFRAGKGLIEILYKPTDANHHILGLDYRTPQGVFAVIQVTQIDQLFGRLKSQNISFKQEIVDQKWGHRSFTIIDPNGVYLLFIQE